MIAENLSIYMEIIGQKIVILHDNIKLLAEWWPQKYVMQCNTHINVHSVFTDWVNRYLPIFNK